jgi:hypothetical protein
VSRLATQAGEPTTRRWLVLVVVCISALIVNLDNTILNVALPTLVLPTLVRKLDATSSELLWIVDPYAMAFGGLLLVGGSPGRVGCGAGALLPTATNSWSDGSPKATPGSDQPPTPWPSKSVAPSASL